MARISKHITLIGFMGAGKSTIGRILAKELDIDFIDLDDYIEQKYNRTISSIFNIEGELYFRKIEFQSLKEVLQKEKCTVISLGGGTPCIDGAMDLINKNSLSIYIKLGIKRLYERLKHDENRPLLQQKSKFELLHYIENKMRSRRAYYLGAKFTVLGYYSPNEVVEHIQKKVKNES